MLFLGAPIISDNLEAKTDTKKTVSSETIKTSKNFDDAPIEINNSSDFSDYNGSGTAENPYIIDDLRIQPGSDNFGILIRNTDDHFKIKNVTVINSWSSTYGAFNLENVTNGKLTNNSATNSTMGFRLEDSNYNNLTDNFAEENALGFCLTNSTSNNNNNNTLKDNTVNNNGHGIILGKSHNCTIDGNTVSKNEDNGISLAESHKNTINNNMVNENKDYGLYLG
ncbi:MAG: NosD domain-containing protein, partial [Promethearchaeia archaeon]